MEHLNSKKGLDFCVNSAASCSLRRTLRAAQDWAVKRRWGRRLERTSGPAIKQLSKPSVPGLESYDGKFGDRCLWDFHQFKLPH